MKQVELIEKRKPREKHFLQGDGTIVAEVYDDDVHFLKNGKYEEIDNTLIEKDGYYVNKNNSFKVEFNKQLESDIVRIELNEHYLNIKLQNNERTSFKKIIGSKSKNGICYKNIIDNIDLEYKILSTKLKESIIINEKNKIPTMITFLIESDLSLIISDNGSVYAAKDSEKIFNIEAPYMIDAQGKTNYSINYKLTRENEKYVLNLILDNDWLNSEDTLFPVIVDPTITKYDDANNCQDTYIYPGDTNIDRNSHDFLKAGVEMVNGNSRVNRALLKFSLPSIETGSQIINAKLNLVGYPIIYTDPNAYHYDIINIHRITSDWSETTANWNNMNSNYDSKIEGTFKSYRSIYYTGNPIQPSICGDEITSLVKKWYSSDLPNYGIMLKMNTETYHTSVVPQFYSKNNNQSSNPKPFLSIVYRNQNGLESYMNYKIQKYSQGKAYINSYNGNLTTIFDICETIGGKFPAYLKLVYNTNDVLLQKNVGCGLGYMFNYNQTVKKVTIEDINYYAYVDADGTVHYFYEKDNEYKDEDGMNFKIVKDNSKYLLTDKSGNTMSFTIDTTSLDEIGYLTEIKDLNNNTIVIQYSNNLISKIIDANNQEINITYGTDIITIVSPDQSIYLDYNNNKLTCIRTIYGNTSFLYNSNNIITKITDPTGLSFEYDYYSQSPYRMKKVTQYGLNNEEGRSFDIEYNFNSTTYIENNQKVTTMTFNNFGNLVSTSNLKSSQNLIDAYGKYEQFGEGYMTGEGEFDKYKNKVLSKDIPFKYVKNYLSNSSFEENSIDFQSSSNVSLSISDDYSEIGLNSLKIISSSAGQQSIFKSVTCPKGKYYTFSGYFKNNNNLKLSLYYIDSNNEQIFSDREQIIPNDNFTRYDTSIYYPSNALSDLYIFIEIETNGITYLDCVQLEEGEVANYYNMLDNSDFSNGFSGWELRYSDTENYNGLIFIQPVNNIDPNGIFEIVDVGNDVKALKVNMNPKRSTEFEASLSLKGKKDELYNISFWYKNKGLPAADVIGDYKFNNVTINFNYTEEILPHGGIMSKGFNPNDNEWQYFQTSFIAEENFDKLRLNFFQISNANELYITNMTLIKTYGKTEFDYDDKGNIIEAKDNYNKNLTNKYDKNNQLISTSINNEKNITNEYDNVITDRIISSINSLGMKTENIYDNFNNICLSRTVNYGKNDTIENGIYRIRLKGTYNYISSIRHSVTLSNENCNHYLWNLEKIQVIEQVNGESVTRELYSIKHPILNKYIRCIDNMLILSNDCSLFELSKNDNGSFFFFEHSINKYIKVNNNQLTIENFTDNDYSFEFFFENTNKLFIETNKSYSVDGKRLLSSTDSLLNETIYDINQNTGITDSITKPNGITIDYEHDVKRRLTKITQENRIINLSYNNSGSLQSVSHGNKQYNYIYDNFLNLTQFKICNNVMVNNVYEEKNGNLISSTYGNNDQISFSYDKFNRLEEKTLMDDVITYIYGSNGDLLKVKSNNNVYKYTYDLDRRMSEYRFDDLKIKFNYDNSNNLSKKEYIFNSSSYDISNTYDNNNNIISSSIDNDIIEYSYDYLGRVTGKTINNSYNTNYTYVKNGNRTSLIVRDYIIGNDTYSYRYNKLNNITHIYKNNVLIKSFNYDEYEQLVSEKNYSSNEKIVYQYDIYGNILSKKKYNLTNDALVSQKLYEYNNANWVDQLTKYDDEIITYDTIGNPLTIGSKTLTWINGRQLHTYSDGTNTISYKYNKDGIRIEKNINNTLTKYYLENSKIIIEKRGNDYITYLYDANGDLFGFKYNNNKYYYIKNSLNDILGIMDSNYSIIAKYEYDSYGRIVSILDALDNDVSNNYSHIANINPFRYRSYYYDLETNLYYLNTRYYNPEWGRFLNSDGIININSDTNGYNLFTYCNNNPINYSDPNGNFPWVIAIAIAVVVALIPTAVQFIARSAVVRKDKSYSDDSLVAKKMIKSPRVKKIFNESVSKYKESEDETPQIPMNYSLQFYHPKNIYDLDLMLSVGKADFTVDVTEEIRRVKDGSGRLERRYVATIKATDRYDFPDNWADEATLVNFLNYCGWVGVQAHVLEEYDWDVSFKMSTEWELKD